MSGLGAMLEKLKGFQDLKHLSWDPSKLLQSFPGITLEALREGRIPVATSVLEQHLKARIQAHPHVTDIQLRSEPGLLHLEVEVERFGAKARVDLPIACSEFVFDKERQKAVFLIQGDAARAHGENWLGQLLGNLPALILVKALKGPDFAEELEAASDGAVSLDWPRVEVELSSVPELKRILELRVQIPILNTAFGLLDFLKVHALEIDQDRVWVQVGVRNPLGD